jgi:predicted RNase H-like HicB family nuclease
MSQLPPYAINLFWSEEDACWIADVPDLQFCSAHGDTPEDALREVREAMTGWLESWDEEGRPRPPVHYRPVPAQVPSAAE